MGTNRISSYLEPSATAVATASALPGFALCPGSPQSLAVHLAALQQAYRELVAAAERKAVERALAASFRGAN